MPTLQVCSFLYGFGGSWRRSVPARLRLWHRVVTVTHQGRGKVELSHREPSLSLGVACPAGATLPQGPPGPGPMTSTVWQLGPSVGPLGGDSWTALGSCSCFTHMTTAPHLSTFWAVDQQHKYCKTCSLGNSYAVCSHHKQDLHLPSSTTQI